MSEPSKSRSHSATVDPAPEKSGWLLKQSHSIIRIFRRKFVVLENKHLFIYSDEHKKALKAVLNFDQVPSQVSISSSDPCKVIISFVGNTIVLKGKKEEIFGWEKSISASIQRSRPDKMVAGLTSVKKFWKFFYLTEPEFRKTAETGDLMLFKGKSTISGALRGILSSEFDHIAVIYILNGYIYLFESARSTGVVLTSWDEFINRNWNEMYLRVGYRKLLIERNERFLETAHEFIVENEGKPYKLMKFLGSGAEGFFCSELVAEFYRKTGVFYMSTPAKKFMPKHFVGMDMKIIQGELDLLKDIRFK